MCPEILINPINDLRRKDRKTCKPGRQLLISCRVDQHVRLRIFVQAKPEFILTMRRIVNCHPLGAE